MRVSRIGGASHVGGPATRGRFTFLGGARTPRQLRVWISAKRPLDVALRSPSQCCRVGEKSSAHESRPQNPLGAPLLALGDLRGQGLCASSPLSSGLPGDAGSTPRAEKRAITGGSGRREASLNQQLKTDGSMPQTNRTHFLLARRVGSAKGSLRLPHRRG